jgi:hypothetical protein
MGLTDQTQPLPWGNSQNGQNQLPPGYGGTSWLNYLASMFGPGQAQAGGVDAQGRPADAIAALRAGGTPPVDPNAVNSAIAPNANPVGPPPPGPPVGQGILPQARGLANPYPGQGVLPQARGLAVPPGPMAPGNTILNPGAAVGANPAVAGGTTGTPRAAPQGADNRFVTLDQGQNIDPTGRNRGGPQASALNLAGLFGGGRPAAANPNAPAPNAQPVSALRPVPGPMANAPMPPTMPADVRRQRAAQLPSTAGGYGNPRLWG